MNDRRRLLLQKAIERSEQSKKRRIGINGDSSSELVPNSRPISTHNKPVGMTWEYGITTVPERRSDLLPRTIQSLRDAGFDKPRLFIDGSADPQGYRNDFKLDVTVRERIRTYGNWYLGMCELYIRNPLSERYAMFQDDIICCKGLREYLEHCTYPDHGYMNLITYPQNEVLKIQHNPGVPKDSIVGWYPSNQLGKGAQGLVFNRETLIRLLTSPYLADRVQDEKRGHRGIDGGIVMALKGMSYTEYVHSPSLIRHVGVDSTMGNHPQPLDVSFRGEDWDAMELIKTRNVT